MKGLKTEAKGWKFLKDYKMLQSDWWAMFWNRT